MMEKPNQDAEQKIGKVFLVFARICIVALPFVFLSIFWAFGIQLVTAFLYQGLPARPFWNNPLMASTEFYQIVIKS